MRGRTIRPASIRAPQDTQGQCEAEAETSGCEAENGEVKMSVTKRASLPMARKKKAAKS
jgi:hypothetical protein